MKALSTNVLRRTASQLAPRARPWWLETPVSVSRRSDAPTDRPRVDKVLSVEMELGGLAVELKAKGLRGLITWAAFGAAGLAVLQELMRPRQFRTWHGRVAGIVPYDFRRPTLRRFLNALWAPDNPRLLSDTAFGVGWTINLAQLPRVILSGAKRPSSADPSYVAPRVKTESSR